MAMSSVNGAGTGATFSNAAGARSAMAQLGFPLNSRRPDQRADCACCRTRAMRRPARCVERHRRELCARADATLEYAQPRGGYTRGVTLDAGRDEYAAAPSCAGRLRALRWRRRQRRRGRGRGDAADNADDADDAGGEEGQDRGSAAASQAAFERFVDRRGRRGHGWAWISAASRPRTRRRRFAIRTHYSPHLGIGSAGRGLGPQRCRRARRVRRLQGPDGRPAA